MSAGSRPPRPLVHRELILCVCVCVCGALITCKDTRFNPILILFALRDRDNLSTNGKIVGPKVSLVQRLHCNPSTCVHMNVFGDVQQGYHQANCFRSMSPPWYINIHERKKFGRRSVRCVCILFFNTQCSLVSES